MSENTPSSATPGWFDISTPDSPRSRAFYGDLFGWAVQGLDDNFAMVSGGEGQPPAGSIATAVEGSPYVGWCPTSRWRTSSSPWPRPRSWAPRC